MNNTVLPIKYDYISIDANLIIATINGTKDLFDFNGNQISHLKFSTISHFKNDQAIIGFPNKKNTIINKLGAIIFKTHKVYSYEGILNDGLYLVKNNLTAKKGVINGKGELIIKCNYDELEQSNSIFIVKLNIKKGFISQRDSVLKSFKYDAVGFCYFDNEIESIVKPRENLEL